MNRRQLVHAGAAGAVLLARVPKVPAATYDLIIKGGRVIDPSVELESERQSRVSGPILSTDWNVTSKTTGIVDFPNVMSKFLMLGMPLKQIIACATFNAARVFPPFEDRGALNVGAPADVAILELREGTFAFVDN
jgi:dihydroorotase